MNQEKHATGMHVGSATLVMVFAVLTMTIFAVLSMVTANNEWKLAQKNADAVTAYYQADTEAVEIFDKISSAYHGQTMEFPLENNQIITEYQDTFLNYWVPIDATQHLWVQLTDQRGTVEVVRWQVEEMGTWNAQDSNDVWDGNATDNK